MASDRPYRPVYKSAFVVTGLLLLVLGIGNWTVGAVRARPYQESGLRSPGSDASPPAESLKNALLDEPEEEGREERTIDRAKLEFYELVRSGGRLMVVLGSLSLLAGLSRVERGRPWNLPIETRNEKFP